VDFVIKTSTVLVQPDPKLNYSEMLHGRLSAFSVTKPTVQKQKHVLYENKTEYNNVKFHKLTQTMFPEQ